MNFRNYISESKIDYLEVLTNSVGSNKKMDQDMWDWFEKNLDDSGIYPGDAVPEDYLEIMTDKQAKELYDLMMKKYKKVMNMHMNEDNNLS